MAEIVEFKKPDEDVYTLICVDCSCVTFQFLSTMKMLCANCKRVCTVDKLAGYEWVAQMPEPPGNPRVTSEEITVVSIDDPRASLRNFLKASLSEDTHNELVALVAIHDSGRLRTWGGVEEMERLPWLIERMADAVRLLNKTNDHGSD